MQISEQTGDWHALHPAMVFLGIFSRIRSIVIYLALGGVAAAQGNTSFLVIMVFLGVVFPALVLFFKFLSYRYQLTQGHVVIKEGILARKIRSIPVKRIHNVNTSQSLLARHLGVVQLDIETAGGGQAEASMVALSLDAAREVQDYIAAERRRAGAPDVLDQTRSVESDVNVTSIFRITAKEITIAGATTNRMGLIFAGLIAITQYFENALINLMPDWVGSAVEVFSSGPHESSVSWFMVLLAGFFLLFLLAWIISIASAFVQLHQFTLNRVGQDFKIRTGLFTVREYTIPSNKIQALRCRISAVRRPFGLQQISVHSAGHVGVQEQKQIFDLLIPMAHRSQTGRYVGNIWSDATWDQVQWQGVHSYTRLRHFRILGLIVILASQAIFWFGWPLGVSLTLLAIWWCVGLLGSWLVAHLTFKQTAFAHDRRYVYIKSGFVGLQFWVIPINRIQNLAVTQTPFQRNRRLASLSLDVAGPTKGGQATIPNIELQEAWRLFNRFLSA